MMTTRNLITCGIASLVAGFGCYGNARDADEEKPYNSGFSSESASSGLGTDQVVGDTDTYVSGIDSELDSTDSTGLGTDVVVGDTDILVDSAEDGMLYEGPCTIDHQQLMGERLMSQRYEVFTYDRHNNLLRIESIDPDFNKVVNRSTFSYDAGNRLITEEYDSLADDLIDHLNRYTYDDQGTLLTKDQYGDQGENGTWETHIRSSYDTDGNVIMEETDEAKVGSHKGIDGISDRVERCTYDDEGRLLIREQDINADGVVDSRYINTYDSWGNLVLYEHDDFADGEIERARSYQYTYDEHGNILEELYDQTTDGVVDSIIIRTYDDASRLVSQNEDRNADGEVDYISTYEYNDAGNQILEEVDIMADGIIDRQTYDEYNEEGLLVKHTFYEGSEEPSSEREYIYDKYGNLLQETYLSQVSSGFLYVDYYSYECWE